MVDFQSRSSRRTADDEEDEDVADESDAETEQSEQPDEKTEEQSLAYAVVTVTGQRSLAEDTQGDRVVECIEEAGGTVSTRDLIQPSYDGVQSTVDTLAQRGDVDAIITIGGTGVEPTDVTVEALERIFDRWLPGFGELFRRLSYDERGTGVVGTRTTAGIVAGAPVFAVPGTLDGAALATEEIIVVEAPSLVADASVDEEEMS